MADEIVDAFEDAFEDYQIPGVPASGVKQVSKSQARALGQVVQDVTDQLAANAAGGLIGYKLWTELAAHPTGALTVGLVAKVLGPDAGTHVDPVLGGDPVANEGIYNWSATPAGFKRVGNLEVDDAAAQVALAAAQVGLAADQVALASAEADRAQAEADSLNDRLQITPDADRYSQTFEDEDENFFGGIVKESGDLELIDVEDGEEDPEVPGYGSVQKALTNVSAQLSFARGETAWPARDPSKVWTTWPQVLIIEHTGQSGKTGANSQPAVTTTQKYPGRTKSFNGGVKANPDNAASTMTSIVDAVEDDLSGDGDLGRGETSLSTTANVLLERLYKRTGQPLTDFPILHLHTCADGGEVINTLRTTKYSRFLTSLQKAKELYDLAGLTSACGVISVDQGESDQGVRNTDHWVSEFGLWRSQMIADVMDIFDQPHPPIIIVVQKSWSTQATALTAGGHPNTYPASVTLAANEVEDEDTFISHPDYGTFFNGDADSVGTHRGSQGNRATGYPEARTIDLALFQGLDVRPLKYLSSWVVGRDCYVKLRVPVKPIRKAAVLGWATQCGLALTDDSGDWPFDTGDVNGGGVEIVDGDTLRITANRDRDGVVTLSGGLTALPELCGLHPYSGGTNICDSGGDAPIIDGVERPMPNWLLAFRATPLIMDDV